VHLYRMKTGQSLLISCVFLTGLAAPALSRSSLSFMVAEGGRGRAAIVLGEGMGSAYQYAATELQKYLRALSGTQISIIRDSQISGQVSQQTLIFVGGADS